jgi:chromosome segregation ATPase
MNTQKNVNQRLAKLYNKEAESKQELSTQKIELEKLELSIKNSEMAVKDIEAAIKDYSGNAQKIEKAKQAMKDAISWSNDAIDDLILAQKELLMGIDEARKVKKTLSDAGFDTKEAQKKESDFGSAYKKADDMRNKYQRLIDSAKN